MIKRLQTVLLQGIPSTEKKCEQREHFFLLNKHEAIYLYESNSKSNMRLYRI